MSRRSTTVSAGTRRWGMCPRPSSSGRTTRTTLNLDSIFLGEDHYKSGKRYMPPRPAAAACSAASHSPCALLATVLFARGLRLVLLLQEIEGLEDSARLHPVRRPFALVKPVTLNH